jgi:HD-like signal output (HDOD) protein
MDKPDNPIEINPPNYRDAILLKQDFCIQFSVFTREAESSLMKMIRTFLSCHDILYLRDVIITIIKELITNAVKANAKRLYFKSKNLSIENPDDYKIGMTSFKSEVLYDNSPIIQQIIKTNLKVRVVFTAKNGSLCIKVINNIAIVPEELARIQEKIRKAYAYDDITDAFSDELDDTEGAGLGLVMGIMVFRNAGFSPQDFKITAEGSKTISSIMLYERPDRRDMESKIADGILKEVDTLPSFPDQLKKIELMCNNPKSSIVSIANAIKQDVALTTSILRLANSASYITVKRTETIEDSIKVIGINGLKTLLVASGVQQIMESRYRQYKEFWNDSYKRAFYAQKIAVQLTNPVNSEVVYISALLSEIGRAVLLSVKNEAIVSLSKISGLRATGTIDMIEEMALGVSHATLGGLIAKKWQFSEALCKTIEYYPRPYLAPSEYRDIVFTVHLAHVFTEIDRKKYRFEIVDDEVLDYFHLSSKETFEKLHAILKEAYNQNNTK